MPRTDGENKHIKLQFVEGSEERFKALTEIFSALIEQEWEQLEGIAPDGDEIPDEQSDDWSYHKGKLDAYRMAMSQASQALIAEEMQQEEVTIDEVDLSCPECGSEGELGDGRGGMHHVTCSDCDNEWVVE